MTTPRVSVVVPTFNRAGKLGDVLTGVAEQTFNDLDVVVVDDASVDDTKAVVDRWRSDLRLTYLRHDINRGGNAARLTGIRASRGRYVAFLDSDDRWLPTKLERQVDLLAALGPDFGLCSTWYDMTTPSGEVRYRVEPRYRGLHVAGLLVANYVGGYSSILVERRALDLAGGPDPALRACQDWDLYLRVNAITGWCVVEEPLVEYCLDEADPVRISTRRNAVISGHRHMYRQVRARYGDLDENHRLDSARAFMASFANAGSPSDVLGVCRDVPHRLWTKPVAGYAAHMLVRSVRKAATLGEFTRE